MVWIWSLILTSIITWPILGAKPTLANCSAPNIVCKAKSKVYNIRSFSPAASAVRIGPELLVTNRHVVVNKTSAQLVTHFGEVLEAAVIPSKYPGDLILLRVKNLPEGTGLLPAALTSLDTVLYTVGFDIGRQAIRIYRSGLPTTLPISEKHLSRIHHNAQSQPGNSGGALIDSQGRLVGIVSAGGEGRHDAIPATDIKRLKAMSGEQYKVAHNRISLAYRQCMAATANASQSRQTMTDNQTDFIFDRCIASNNRQLLDSAAQTLGRRGFFEKSIKLFKASLSQDPGSLNTRLGLVVTLHLARQYKEEVPHLRILLQKLPKNLQVLRFAIQAGTWSETPALADKGMTLLKKHHPKLAPLAARFRNTPSPRQGR